MCSIESTLTLTEPSQTTSLTECPTFTGSVEIAPDFNATDLILDTIELFDGNFTIENPTELTSFSAPSLRNITGTLTIEHTPALTTLNLPNLTYTNSLTIRNTALQTTENIVLETAYNIQFYDNPELTDFTFPNLQTTEYLYITGNNAALASISFPLLQSDVVEQPTDGANKGIDIEGNNSTTVSFPVLTSVTSFQMLGCASLSVPVLQSANLNVNTNPKLTDLDFPALEHTNGQFQIDLNPELKNISAPVFVGSANQSTIITSNNELTEIYLPMLETLDRGTFEGSLTSISFPALTSITGDLNISSTSELINTSCTHLETLAKDGFSCTYPRSDSKSDEAEKIGGGIGGAVAAFVVIAGLIVGVVYWRMRGRGKGKKGGFGVIGQGQGQGYELR